MDNSGYVGESGVTSFSLPSPDDHSGNVPPSSAHEDLEDVKVKIDSSRSSSLSASTLDSDGPYAGMPKEVLLQYSRQAKFVWARNILTALVLLTILTLIALVIAVVVISPPCLEFWQTSPIYQIYPKSYLDADGNDGYGDLKGIIEKLDYLNDDLGVKVLWLNPVYASPQVDNGYDISDFRDIYPEFGTMEDMDNLIIEMHNRGMKLLMDFVPNHSSDKHKWFLASSNTSHPDHEIYRDYYVWVDGDKDVLPNNWVSEFNNASGWTWNDDRKQFYFHGFFPEQPDLNLRNPDVRNEIKDILRFWLEKGVDGFRCDAVAFMFEAEHLRDNPVPDPSQNVTKDNIYPDYTQNYQGVHDIIAEWRALLDEYSTEPGVYRFMEIEVYADIQTTMRYYGTQFVREGDFPMNFELIKADPATDWTAAKMKGNILSWMENMPEGKWANWVMSNHDNSRLPSRVGNNLARCAALMIMTLPGTPGLYYGDEIGMEDNDIPDMKDFRDPERTPMQWSNTKNAGFCGNCTPWLPVNENYKTGITVEDQLGTKNSMLEMYKQLISLRTDIVYQRGYLCVLEVIENTLIFVRDLPGLGPKMVLINFDSGAGTTSFNLKSTYADLSAEGKVEFSTDIGNPDEMDFSNVVLKAGTGVIVRFSTNKPFHSSDSCFINLKVCYNRGLGIVQTC
ncbi:amino acid transporter heavy chain SLC3A1-like [Styela clava]